MRQKWLFALVAAALPAFVMAGSYGDPCCNYDPCCCDPCYSQSCCDPCCDPCGWDCCGSIEIFGEALYLQPTTCSFSYVVEDCNFCNRSAQGPFAVVPQGKEHGICPDYEWGFRVGAGYVMDCGCRDVRAYYSRLCTNDTKHVCDISDCGALWPTYGPAELLNFNNLDGTQDVFINGQFEGGICAQAKNRVRVEWDAVDVEVAARQMRRCDLWLRGHVGLEWTEICVRRHTHYEGSTPGFDEIIIGQNAFVDVNSHTRSWGVGPRLGVDLRYDVFCGFGISARAGAGLFAGETRHNNDACARLVQFQDFGEEIVEVTYEQQQDVGNRSKCVVFPEFDAALGINYLWCCGDCFSFLFEVGYEWRTYLNTVDHSYYLDDSAEANNAPVCDHFAFSGLFIRGMITF